MQYVLEAKPDDILHAQLYKTVFQKKTGDYRHRLLLTKTARNYRRPAYATVIK